MSHTATECKQALARGAPLHAGANADPTDILDQQDIIDVIGKQLVEGSQGDPAAICKGLTIWSSLQRLPCSADVFEHACEYLGFWGTDAREKALFWMGKQSLCNESTQLQPRNVDVDWEAVFGQLCLCIKQDRKPDGKSYGLVERWANVLQVTSPECAKAATLSTMESGMDPDGKRVSKMCAEMYDHATFGYMPEWEEMYTKRTRWLFQRLARSLVGLDRAGDIPQTGGGTYGPAQSRARSVLLMLDADWTILPEQVEDALRNVFDNSSFTPNTRVLRGPGFSEILSEHITLDLAAYLLPRGGGRDAVIGGSMVPNIMINAVLSHPDYDPRKCINMPSTCSLSADAYRWSGGVTLLGMYLAEQHSPRTMANNDMNSNKLATLTCILDHPLQDLRQKSNGAGLVHLCLSQTIRGRHTTHIKDLPWEYIRHHMTKAYLGWQWRYQALAILWDKTCNGSRDDRCIWRWKDNEGRTPRELFEHKWGIFRRDALCILSPYLRSKDSRAPSVDAARRVAAALDVLDSLVENPLIHREDALGIVKAIDEAYNPLNELFIVAERG